MVVPLMVSELTVGAVPLSTPSTNCPAAGAEPVSRVSLHSSVSAMPFTLAFAGGRPHAVDLVAVVAPEGRVRQLRVSARRSVDPVDAPAVERERVCADGDAVGVLVVAGHGVGALELLRVGGECAGRLAGAVSDGQRE